MNKHNKLLSVVAETHHFKWNSRAEDSIYIELGQTHGKKWIPQRWVDDPTCAVTVFGNEKLLFYFKRETLKKMQSVYPVVEMELYSSKGYILSIDEAKKRSDFWVDLRF